MVPLPLVHFKKVPQVLIVGAGPTGLVLGLWLNRLGVEVRIIDKAPRAGTTSRAIGVHARTLEFYRQAGLADQVVADGIKAAGVNLWVEGARVASVPLTAMGQGETEFPFVLMYPQDVHERLLVQILARAGVTVERSTELLRFDQTEDRVWSVLRLPDGTEETVETPFIAGCDGASSCVRQALTQRFPGGTYEHLFYVADVEATGPAVDRQVHIDLGRAEFLGIFPLVRPGHVRVIGSVRDPLAKRTEALTFADVRGDALQAMRLEITRENWFSTYRVHHRVAERFRWNRAFLLGDAAHIHSPVGAQGMNTGIGDALNLAWKLASVLNAGAAETLLESYEEERKAFARRLVATTDRVFTVATNRSWLARFARTKLLPKLLPRVLGVRTAGKALFRTMSQLGIRYRESPLSEGGAGRIRGGDRLPWVRLESGRDNYAVQDGLGWGLHVWGDVAPGVEAVASELKLPLHRFEWGAEAEAAGFMRDACYLVRPDGYVARADPEGAPDALRGYFLKRRFEPLSAEEAGVVLAARTGQPVGEAPAHSLQLP
jgi:2-polyprenyl-6-methoxyphenol hydroxylase-like FAD-dependent oxidoreductase